MDSVMLGSLHTYRRWIKSVTGQETLSLFAHGCAGAMAGFTVSFIASPIEHVKAILIAYFTNYWQARLQVQYSSKDRIYSGPLDAYSKIVSPRTRPTVLTYRSINLTVSAAFIKAFSPQSSSDPLSLSGGQPTNSTPVSFKPIPLSPSPA